VKIKKMWCVLHEYTSVTALYMCISVRIYYVQINCINVKRLTAKCVDSAKPRVHVTHG
jgi:hypothetical protein